LPRWGLKVCCATRPACLARPRSRPIKRPTNLSLP
jgi:hypothetical protein